MKLQYLLFDLDGTLTDSKEGITESVRYALRAFGIEEPDTDKLLPFIGPPLKESFMKYYGLDSTQAETAIAKYREWFAPKGIYQNRLYAGIPEMLQFLKENGRILAVASSKPQVFVETILKHFNLCQYFDVIVGSDLDGHRSEKEEVVEEALRQLDGLTHGAERAKTAMIGDRRHDIAGGKAHQLVTVGVRFGYAKDGELEEAGADYIADTVEQLKELLEQ